MDTLRLVVGAVVAYLGVVLVVGTVTVLPNVLSALAGALFDFVSLATANATNPIVGVDIAIAVTAFLVVALAMRKR